MVINLQSWIVNRTNESIFQNFIQLPQFSILQIKESLHDKSDRSVLWDYLKKINQRTIITNIRMHEKYLRKKIER